MKSVRMFIALVLVAALVRATVLINPFVFAAPAGPTYLVQEDFEDTGTASGWTNSGQVSSTSWDSTSPALSGAQSLYVPTDGGSGGGYAQSPTFTAASEIHGYFIASISYQPWSGTDGILVSLRGSGSEVASIRVTPSMVGRGAHGSATGDEGGTRVVGTTYHWWFRYVAGSGSNGVLEIWVATSATKPGSPAVSISTGTSTADVDQIRIGRTGAANADFSIDKVRIATTAIGSNPS